VLSGDVIEVTFSFNCWLAPDTYSIAVAAHSTDAVSFDWLDGVLFFQVMSAMPMEGVANLNASVTTRRVLVQKQEKLENITARQA
ncbi:MAG: Wzt carbohydrate-binding domain-containing protein, partial [Pyrinomonadaceae bacterium]